jgi:hypothetical protein
MKVFQHHIYEFQKGLRNLVLFTGLVEYQPQIEARLQKRGIDYLVCPLGQRRINVFFGHPACVEVVRQMGCQNLSRLSLEHDFMLGIMLGYDRIKQCERYLQMSGPRTIERGRDTTLPPEATLSLMQAHATMKKGKA